MQPPPRVFSPMENRVSTMRKNMKWDREKRCGPLNEFHSVGVYRLFVRTKPYVEYFFEWRPFNWQYVGKLVVFPERFSRRSRDRRKENSIGILIISNYPGPFDSFLRIRILRMIVLVSNLLVSRNSFVIKSKLCRYK